MSKPKFYSCAETKHIQMNIQQSLSHFHGKHDDDDDDSSGSKNDGISNNGNVLYNLIPKCNVHIEDSQ